MLREARTTSSRRGWGATTAATASILLLAAGPAAAQSPAELEAASGIGRMDPTPAATLLLPYFELDIDNQPGGLTYVMTVGNATAAPVLAHLTLWTDWAIPTVDFDIYLTGFDLQSFDLGAIFATGSLPQTSPMLSNQGALSDPNTLPAGCTEPGELPVGNLPAILLELLREAHTGVSVSFPGFDGACGGQSYGDGLARGFVTVDVVQTCSVLFPSSPGYFDNIAGFDNVLWGDWFRADPANGILHGEALVHIEADPGAFVPGDYTFYGRHVAFTATDGREPLATSWAVRYLNGGSFSGAASLVVWRDLRVDPSPVICGGQPPFPMPLPADQVIGFDEEENPEEPAASSFAFPWATQRVRVGQAALPLAATFGWLFLDLNTSFPPSPLGDVSQSWATVMVETPTGLALAYDAIPLDNALLPGSLFDIFRDDFESGSLSAWSAFVP